MVSLEDALLQKQFFDYLLNRVSTGKSNVYINEDDDKRIYCLDNTENIDIEKIIQQIKENLLNLGVILND